MDAKRDIIEPVDVKLLVDTFYAQVMKDEVIGHFFTTITEINLEDHMPIMYSFWENLLFFTGDYKRNPMEKHVEMHKKSSMTQAHFDQWLAIWKSTVDSLFRGKTAEMAKTKADQTAKLMYFIVNK